MMDTLNTAFNIIMAARDMDYQDYMEMNEKERCQIVDALITLEGSEDKNLQVLHTALMLIFDK